MKRRLAIGVAVLATLVWSTGAMAGDWHSGATLKCQDCHVMHYSQTHGYNSDGGGQFTPLGATADTREYLLRNHINDLCLSCHDGGTQIDVLEGHSYLWPRQAGGLNEDGGSWPDARGHTLGSMAAPPGDDGSYPGGPLTCVLCHAAHGGNRVGINSYRNLGGHGTVAGSNFAITYGRGDVDAPNDGTSWWVYEDASGGNVASHYGVGALTFNEPDPTMSMYGDFCKSCHNDFHGAVGGAEIGGSGTPAENFKRHPANGVNIGALQPGGHSSDTVFGGHVNQVQVMSPAGKKAGTYVAGDDLTPSCMSCHKGHGNQNAFGLIYMSGTGTITEEGDDGAPPELRNLCKQCHVQG